MTKTPRLRHFDVRPPGSADCLRMRRAPADCRTLRRRAGSDQAHTDAAARFVLLNCTPRVARLNARFRRAGISKESLKSAISALTLRPSTSGRVMRREFWPGAR